MLLNLLIITLIVIIGMFINGLMNDRSSYNKTSYYRISGIVFILFAGLLSSFIVILPWKFTSFSFIIYFLVLSSVCLISIYIFFHLLIKKLTTKLITQEDAYVDRYILRRAQVTDPLSASSHAIKESNNITKNSSAASIVHNENEINQADTITSDILKNNDIEIFVQEPVTVVVNKEVIEAINLNGPDIEQVIEQKEQVTEFYEDNIEQFEQAVEMQDELMVNDELKITSEINVDLEEYKQNDDLDITIIPDDSQTNELVQMEQRYILSKQEVIIAKAIALMNGTKYLLAIQLLNSITTYDQDMSIKKQTDLKLIECFIALKDYNIAQKKVFDFLNQRYIITSEEKTKLKEIMLLIKSVNR